MPKVTPEAKAPKRRLIFSRVPGRLDAALAAAIGHLEKDEQEDLPTEERREDRKLVAKLKTAKAPAKPKRAGGLLF